MTVALRGDCVVKCLICGYEDRRVLFKCPRCGGPLITVCNQKRWSVKASEASMWRYIDMMSFRFDRVVSYGEGYTPTVGVGGITLKLETRNPTGSYSDRAASAIVSSFEPGSSYTVGYSEDFASSMAFYAAQSSERVKIIADPSKLDAIDAITVAKYHAAIEFTGEPQVPYENPLSFDAFKTIAFEIIELERPKGKVLVPTRSGLLALALKTGIEEASELLGLRAPEIVAVRLRGEAEPLRVKLDEVNSIEVEPDEMLKGLMKLASRGIYLRPLAAAAYSAADRGDLVIVTGGIKKQPRLASRPSALKQSIMKVLSDGKPRTAYEIWSLLGNSFTLRGVYSTLHSLEEQGIICSSYLLRGSRKVKYYTFCSPTTKA